MEDEDSQAPATLMRLPWHLILLCTDQMDDKAFVCVLGATELFPVFSD